MTEHMLASQTARTQEWVRDHQRTAGMLVLTVALALVAVAVVVGISVFSAPLEVAQTDESPSASPSSEPSEAVTSNQPSPFPTASAEPTPDDGHPSEGPPIAWPPQPDGGTFFFEGIWGVSVVDDLNVRSGPGTEHAPISQLDAGDLFVALAGPGGDSESGVWLQIAAEDGITGFVNPGPYDDPYVLSTPIPWMAWHTTLTGIASNGSSYVAFGTTNEHDYPPYEGGAESLLLVSDDGRSWTSVGEGLGSVRSVAGGTAGWVALTTVYPGVALTSFSADGHTWEESRNLGATSVAYGRTGWVAMIGANAVRSRDGRTWSDAVPTNASVGGDPQIEGSDSGYVAFSHQCCGADIATSPDGVTWSPVTVPIGTGDWFSDVELAGDRLFVLVTDSDTGGTRLHRGTLAVTGTVTWDAPPSAMAAEGLRVDSISQGPDGLLALGWDTDALVPVLWASSDGGTWERLGTGATALGGSVGPEPAWGIAGWVGVGSAVGSIGQQLWSSARGDEWAPVGPAIAYARNTRPCAPITDVSILALAYAASLAEQCYGDGSLTIRAWVPVVTGLGGCCWPDPAPGWLAGPYPRTWLAPGPTDQLRAAVPIYVPPGVDDSALTEETWVEVTGHFRDPAAQECRQTPRNDYPHRLASLEAAQLACRQRFVVESIVTAEGP